MTHLDTHSQPAAKKFGFANLDQIPLSPTRQRMLDSALKRNQGHPAWRARKEMEARDVFGLAEVARINLDEIDLGSQLRGLIRMDVPVPLRPDANNELRIARGAVLGLTYPPEITRQTLPGYVFFQILAPHDVWLPQVRQPEQSLCVAAQVPAGTRVKSLLLMAYGALSMQSFQVDAQDPAGVFDPIIARWWQENLRRYVPLTKTPFLAAHPEAKT